MELAGYVEEASQEIRPVCNYGLAFGRRGLHQFFANLRKSTAIPCLDHAALVASFYFV